MGQTAVQRARQQLVEGIAGGIDLAALRAQRDPTIASNARSSAVLMLFGALDRTPAHTSVSTVPAELDVLLTRRSDALRTHAGQIAFPGGGVEPGDTNPAATALREAHEETGLDPSGVDVLGALPDLHIPVSNYVVTPVVGWWRLPSAVEADHSESVEVFRVPIAELLDPTARGVWEVQLPSGSYRGPGFRLAEQFGGHIVWGFTALVLSAVFDGLGWAVPWDDERLLLEVRR